MSKKLISIILIFVLCVSVSACAAKNADVTDTLASAVQEEQSTEQSSAQSENETKKDGNKKTGTTTAKTEAKKKKSADAQSKAGANNKTDTGGNSDSSAKSGGKQKSVTKAPTTQKNTLDISFTIDCSAALEEVGGLPASGYYCKGVHVSVKDGATAYDALMACCDKQGISVVAGKTFYGMYVSSIGGLAEFDVGKQSGWTYTVNGNYPPRACDKQVLSDGDAIQFIYKAD